MDTQKNALFDLSYLSCLDVIGPSAKEFLQGQLTCDTREITPTLMRQGISCDLKGRILALMDVIEWQGVHLILPLDLLEKTLLSLNKTALLSRVKLQRNTSLHALGFVLNQENDLKPCELPDECYQVIYLDTYCCYRLPNNRFIILTTDPQPMTEPFLARQQYQGSLQWHELQLRDQSFEIYPESRGLFLPHRLQLHKTHRISFNKGCYKGQEIIARTHYLAKQKHQLVQLTLNTAEPIRSGQKMIHVDTHAEIGEIVDYCPLDNNNYLVTAILVLDPPTHCLLEGHHSTTCFAILDPCQ